MMHVLVVKEQACCFQSMSDGYLDGAEDTDVALGLVRTLEGESLDG